MIIAEQQREWGSAVGASEGVGRALVPPLMINVYKHNLIRLQRLSDQLGLY